jgi:transcription antitermination factor NusG
MMPWFAIYSRPFAEKAVAEALRGSMPVFYPFTREVKRVPRGRGHKLVTLERAYFPRYLFAEPRTEELHDVTRTKGVLALVRGRDREPIEVPPRVVAAFRALGDLDGCVEEKDFTKPQKFCASVGDSVVLRWQNHILDGFVAKLSSVARLVSHEEVSVFVRMLGAERECRIPSWAVGAKVAETAVG